MIRHSSTKHTILAIFCMYLFIPFTKGHSQVKITYDSAVTSLRGSVLSSKIIADKYLYTLRHPTKTRAIERSGRRGMEFIAPETNNLLSTIVGNQKQAIIRAGIINGEQSAGNDGIQSTLGGMISISAIGAGASPFYSQTFTQNYNSSVQIWKVLVPILSAAAGIIFHANLDIRSVLFGLSGSTGGYESGPSSDLIDSLVSQNRAIKAAFDNVRGTFQVLDFNKTVYNDLLKIKSAAMLAIVYDSAASGQYDAFADRWKQFVTRAGTDIQTNDYLDSGALYIDSTQMFLSRVQSRLLEARPIFNQIAEAVSGYEQRDEWVDSAHHQTSVEIETRQMIRDMATAAKISSVMWQSLISAHLTLSADDIKQLDSYGNLNSARRAGQ